MKQIFLTVLVGSLVLYGCGSNNTTKNETTTDSTTQAPASASNNVNHKMGLPLGPDQEVPPNTSPGKGTADVSYNKDNHMLSFTINFEGLTSAPTMAHIHGTAPRGVNAGVKHDLSGLLPKSASGSFSDSVMVDGSNIKEDSLLSGFYYFNIHTPANPGGEIRGQIEF